MAGTKGDGHNRCAPELIRLGYVAGAHGVHGAIRIRLDNPDSALLQSVKRLTLVQERETAEYRVARVQSAGQGSFKVILDDVTTAEHATALRGAIAMVAMTALPPTSSRE